MQQYAQHIDVLGNASCFKLDSSEAVSPTQCNKSYMTRNYSFTCNG